MLNVRQVSEESRHGGFNPANLRPEDLRDVGDFHDLARTPAQINQYETVLGIEINSWKELDTFLAQGSSNTRGIDEAIAHYGRRRLGRYQFCLVPEDGSRADAARGGGH